MASSLSSRLASIGSSGTSAQETYQNILRDIATDQKSSQLADNLNEFIGSALRNNALGIAAARPLVGAFFDVLKGISDCDTQIAVGRHTLDILESRVSSFEEQDAALREVVANAYQEEEQYEEAAVMLEGIKLDSSQRKISEGDKVSIWIRICRLYLEVDDTVKAEQFLNRAKNLMHKVADKELKLQFDLSQARILDSHRNFLEASEAYHKVSIVPTLADEERNLVLSKSITCAVLAPAGPQRSRLLAKLYKDDRAHEVEELGMLENMFLDRLISPIETSKFADKLTPHQLAKTADGSTVLAKAVTEHNLVATSKLYRNIGFSELGSLLGLDADIAEEYAARMIEQGRLFAQIDQIDQLIQFGDTGADGERGMPSLRSTAIWDRGVQGLVEDVERVSSLLQAGVQVN